MVFVKVTLVERELCVKKFQLGINANVHHFVLPEIMMREMDVFALEILLLFAMDISAVLMPNVV